MTASSHWGITPRESIAAECVRRGRPAVIDGCVQLLAGADADPQLIMALAGPAARAVLDRDTQRYWLRVWGARGLLWEWDDSATAAIVAGLGDPAWRVREMAAKVVARHRVGDAFDGVAELRADATPRVRAAAFRAVAVLTAGSE